MPLAEKGMVGMVTTLINSTQCGVCHKNVNFTKVDDGAEIPTFTGEHCGNILTIEIQTGKVDVTRKEDAEVPTVKELRTAITKEENKAFEAGTSRTGRNPTMIATEKLYGGDPKDKALKKEIEKDAEKEEKSKPKSRSRGGGGKKTEPKKEEPKEKPKSVIGASSTHSWKT